MIKDKKNKEKPNFFKKILDLDDFKAIWGFSYKVLISGVTLNLSLLIFNVEFSILNIISLGSLLWLLDSKIITMIRRLWFKR